MEYGRFNIILAVTCLFLCSLAGMTNYLVRHVVENPSRYDSFLFGSSRVGKIDVGLIQEGRFYNLYYAEAVPGEYLKDLKILLSEGVKIRNLLVGLDDFSYKVDPSAHLHDHLRHPYGTRMENFQFYLKYLLHIPRSSAIKEYFKKSELEEFYDISNTGMILHRHVDDHIEKNIDKHIKDKKFEKPFRYTGDRVIQTIAEIKEINQICQQEQIRLIIFINPIHMTTYLNCNVEQFNAFKEQLSEVADYFDFSGINTITKNNYYYYETSHYRYVVADLILARIFNDPPVSLPSDFGVLVTRTNLDAHLNNLRNQLARVRE